MDKNTIALIERELQPLDDRLGMMLAATLSSPTGLAYINAACLAQVMGVSLPTAWKNYQKITRERQEENR